MSLSSLSGVLGFEFPWLVDWNVLPLIFAATTLPDFRDVFLSPDPHAGIVKAAQTICALDHVLIIMIWHSAHTEHLLM